MISKKSAVYLTVVLAVAVITGAVIVRSTGNPRVDIDEPDRMPRIAYWWGKVNQHIDTVTGEWQTDPDGVSGANIDKLAYCKKWYSGTNEVREYRLETILDWKERGNINSHEGTFMSYRCVQSPLIRVSTAQRATSSVEVAPSTDVSDINTSDWLTYSDDLHNFTLKYPRDWMLRENYEDLKEAFESGGIPELIWLGPTFIPQKNVKDKFGAPIPIVQFDFDLSLDAFVSVRNVTIQKKYDSDFIYETKSFRVISQDIVDIKSLPANQVPDYFTKVMYIQSRENPKKVFMIKFYGAYSTAYNAKKLTDEILSTFNFMHHK